MVGKCVLFYGSVVAAVAPAFAAQAQTAPAQPSPPAQTAPAPTPAPGDRANDVVVKGTRSDVLALPDRLSFNVANDLQVQTGTVADALRAVPGVEVDLEGNVRLRGDAGVTILVDGRPSAVMRGDNRGQVLQSMPAGQIERVEVITNPSAAFSPEGSGGVINLVMKKARTNTRSATIRATAGPKGRGSLALNGTSSSNGLTLTGDLAYRRFTSEADLRQDRARFDPATGSFVTTRLDATQKVVVSSRTGSLAAEYDLDKKNRISGTLNVRDFAFDADRIDSFVSQNAASSYARTADMAATNRGIGFQGSWRNTLGKEHEFVADLQLDHGRFERQLDGVTVPASGAQAFERIVNIGVVDTYGLKLDYKRPLGEGRSLNVGYEGNLTRNAFDSTGARGPGQDALVPVASLTNRFDYDQTIHALYGTYQFSLGKLDAQPGLRLEQVDRTIDQITDGIHVENGYFRVYPTLNLGYEISAKQKLRGSYSRRIQRPSAQDLNPYTIYVDPVSLRRGNPNLKPEATDSFELGWQLRNGGTFYSVTAFYRRATGGVTDVLSDLGSGVFLTTRANLATATRVGTELVANGKLSKTLSYNASATFLWNEIDTRQAGFAPRSGTTGTVRANLTWQPTTKDFFQLNGNYSGRQLLPQGYREGVGILNLGYRRKIDEKLSLLFTAQNVLDTAKQTIVFDTPTLRDRLTQRGPGQIFMAGITWNLGGQTRRRPEPAFDFSQGSGAGPQ